jgi:hypothetical protein
VVIHLIRLFLAVDSGVGMYRGLKIWKRLPIALLIVELIRYYEFAKLEPYDREPCSIRGIFHILLSIYR